MIRKRKTQPDYVICDRWVNDILVDLGTKKHDPDFLNTSHFNKFQGLLPRKNLQFVIFRENERILDCRPESREDPDFFLRAGLYNQLKEKKEVRIINNSGTIDDCVDAITGFINLIPA
jgi:hypothetical protein